MHITVGLWCNENVSNIHFRLYCPLCLYLLPQQIQIFVPTEKLNAFAQIKYAVISSDFMRQSQLSKYFGMQELFKRCIINSYAATCVERLKWFKTLSYLHSVCSQVQTFRAWFKTVCQWESRAPHIEENTLNANILFKLSRALC